MKKINDKKDDDKYIADLRKEARRKFNLWVKETMKKYKEELRKNFFTKV